MYTSNWALRFIIFNYYPIIMVFVFNSVFLLSRSMSCRKTIIIVSIHIIVGPVNAILNIFSMQTLRKTVRDKNVRMSYILGKRTIRDLKMY